MVKNGENEMTFGAVDIPTKSVDDFRKTLSGLEVKLSDAKGRRDKILIERQKTSALVDKGDKQARLAQAGLNKEEAAAGRLILSLERELAEAKKCLAMGQAQVDAVRAKAGVPIAENPADRLFLVSTPHNLHHVRHKARTIEALRARLLPGYNVQGEIFGANDAGEGGVVAAISPTGPSIMAGLLQAFGDELITFLAERGIVGSGKPVVVMPSNNREKLQ
jgi:hypothetical protein